MEQKLCNFPPFCDVARHLIAFRRSTFKRVNDFTIVWDTTKESNKVSNGGYLNVFIELVFNEYNHPSFVLHVVNRENSFTRQFTSPEKAIQYLNYSIREADKLRNRCEKIWEQYGF